MADAEVMRYITGKTSTREEAETFLSYIRAQYPEGNLGWFAVRPNPEIETGTALPPDHLLGIACLKPFRGEMRETFGEHIELGYWFAQSSWGKGYASAVAAELVRYGFCDLRLEEIVAVADTANLASNRVLQKAGLQHQRSTKFMGKAVEYYALGREEYKANITRP